MALIPIPTTVLANDGQDFTITDDTVYGGAEPTRAESLVDWTIVRKESGGDVDITPTYDNTTDFNANPLVVPIDQDGSYEITILITDSTPPWAGAPFAYSFTDRKLVLYNSNQCYVKDILAIVKDALCGCESQDALLEAMLLSAKIDGADNLGCVDNDMPSAQLVVENIQETCNCSNC